MVIEIKDVGVLIIGEYSCMILRGVKKLGILIIIMIFIGEFEKNDLLR